MSTSIVSSLYNVKAGQVVIYSDINSNPVLNNSPLAVNLTAIMQSLDNLFSTEQYERPFLPEYYNPFISLLGEPITDETAAAIVSLMFAKVNQFEPRIIIDNVNTIVTPIPVENKYAVKLVFSVKLDVGKEKYQYSVDLYNTIT